MASTIQEFNQAQTPDDRAICDILMAEINRSLPGFKSKIWHAHPVWFDDGNPTLGYNKLTDSFRLLFWSGQSFAETGLSASDKFKAAEVRYANADQVNVRDLRRWLEKSLKIQWDYKNIVKRRGKLVRLV